MCELSCIFCTSILGDFVDTAAPLHTQEMHLLVDDGIIAEAHGADRVLSVDDAALVSTPFVDHLHPDDRERTMDAMGRLSAGTPIDIEFRIQPEPNRTRWAWAQGQPIFEDNTVSRVGGFVRDITRRRQRAHHLHVIDQIGRAHV